MAVAADLAIRSFREEDAAEVVALWRRVFPDAPAHNIPDEDIRRKLSVQPDLFLVAEIGSRIVATAMAGFDGHRGWIYYVGVDPEHQRRGFGEAIMREAERRLADLGCPKLNLQVRAGDPGAVLFYERIGFAVEERVSMGKRLD